MRRKYFDLFLLLLLLLFIFTSLDGFASRVLKISDYEFKHFLLDQSIDIESIWEEDFYDCLSSKEESYLSMNINFEDIPKESLQKYKECLEKTSLVASREIDLKLKKTFLGKNLEDEKELLKGVILDYFSLKSLVSRILKKDEFLLDTPSLPFLYEERSESAEASHISIKTYSDLAQSEEVFRLHEVKPFQKELAESFVEKHKMAFQIGFYSLILSSQISNYLKNNTNIIDFLFNPKSDNRVYPKNVCPLPYKKSQPMKNTFLKEFHDMCPAEKITDVQASSLEFFSEDDGCRYLNVLERIKGMGLPLSLIKKIPLLTKYFRSLSPDKVKKIENIYKNNYRAGLNLKSSDYKKLPLNDKDTLELFEKTIESLESHQGTFYHGVPVGIYYATEDYKVGTVISLKDYMSTSSKASIALNFASESNIFFTIHTQTGKSIKTFSASPQEEEYILAPGRKLEIIGVEKIPLRELLSPRDYRTDLYETLTHVTLIEKD